MPKYFLMHKNEKCGVLFLDEKINRIIDYKDMNNRMSPFLGNATLDKMIKWWEARSVPASRIAIQDMIRKTGCVNAETYLAKNLALSMTDTYWIKPENTQIDYDNIKFSNFAAYNNGKVPYHNMTSYDPNASLGGQMEKYWDLENKPPVLVKESYKYYGQQSLNEVFATKLHEMQDTKIPFVKYHACITEDGGILSKCNAFTSESVELIPAYEVIESVKSRNELSTYDAYIQICAKNGIDEALIRDFMDYQTLTDFLISNTDEHLSNFGVLRNADSMQLIGPAPIYDSGNSMFFSESKKTPYSRVELLEKRINGLYKQEGQILSRVKNKNLLRLDSIPSAADVKNLYAEAGLPEWKADIISQNYETKAQMLKEFQKGKTISLYNEKRAAKTKIAVSRKQEFIMMCGIPGAGKTAKAKEILESLKKSGQYVLNAKELYPIENIINTSELIEQKQNLLRATQKYNNAVVFISTNEIREELKTRYPNQYSEDLVFIIAKERLKDALINGASVIYDAMNIDKNTRISYLELAKNAGVTNTTLHIMYANPQVASKDTRMQWTEKQLNAFYCRLMKDIPIHEKWSNVIEHNTNFRKYLNLDTESIEEER